MLSIPHSLASGNVLKKIQDGVSTAIRDIPIQVLAS